jgi:hypothetical protein
MQKALREIRRKFAAMLCRGAAERCEVLVCERGSVGCMDEGSLRGGCRSSTQRRVGNGRQGNVSVVAACFGEH